MIIKIHKNLEFNKDRNIYIYFHICCLNNWRDIVINIFNKIRDSGLYNMVDEIRCCVLGNFNENDEIFQDNKVRILKTSENLKEFENFTVDRLLEDSKKESFYVLYLHSKGVTKPKSLPVQDWVDYMLYFNVESYLECLEYIKENDTVGVNLTKHPVVHYSGNFWWSKSDHIKNLNVANKTYNGPEFWITSKKNKKYLSMFNSRCHCHHYRDRYLRDKYVNKKNLYYL